MVYSQGFPTYVEAIQAERQIKRWSRAKKEALIRGDFELLNRLAECRNESHFKTESSDCCEWFIPRLRSG